ncbi:MAG: AbrB/MazE/SpoVT family DNA-binding domain-containing protein [Chloroflexi bacterium]|nr:AbrB/MazE/SpoVT family DNA-binding domain-containing protein [Chloroflexota bacterium]
MASIGYRGQTTAKVSPKGWIVIPVRLRKRYGIQPGGEVHIVEKTDGLYIVPQMKDPIRETAGKYAGEGSLLADLIEERGRDVQHER